MTKEEIISSNFGRLPKRNLSGESYLDSSAEVSVDAVCFVMDEFAKQQSIAFVELVYTVVPEYNLLPDGKWRCNTGHEYTTIQLYEIFLEYQKNHPA